MSHVRTDDIARMPAEDRAQFIEKTRSQLPANFRAARITYGEKAETGWVINLVTRLTRVGKQGQRWIARSIGDNFEVTPMT
jgi:hypothetical protein